jgi:hypothetical protein
MFWVKKTILTTDFSNKFSLEVQDYARLLLFGAVTLRHFVVTWSTLPNTLTLQGQDTSLLRAFL